MNTPKEISVYALSSILMICGLYIQCFSYAAQVLGAGGGSILWLGFLK